MTPAVGNDIVPYGPGGPAANAERGERAQAADFDTTYQQYLSSNSLSQTDPGVTVGAAAAAGIIALRESDGSFPVPPRPIFTGGTARGVWPQAPEFLPMAVPWLGNDDPTATGRTGSSLRFPSEEARWGPVSPGKHCQVQ